ncbi:hypothetical protein SAY87_008426 [Trapa incisa]|uniref:Uncharacterized protein n=2 Tax=Trapa TaxID=22665 RepID=A0AAN7QUY3_TRANT|nr:hypothetical protein SAY87_008426 [Trapa incisa]KAK4776900.1 hypothetical protein SAY86_005588 [Trapa natans]
MEKLVRPYDKECMRMAMLKHEETFRQQVYELHRLYGIQKLLMKTIGSNVANGGILPNLPCHVDRPDCCRSQKRVDLGITGASETIEESQIELTLGPPTYNKNRPRPRRGDRILTSSSLSSSSTGSSSDNNFTISKLGGFRPAAVIEEDHLLKSQRPNHPPWILQALSLNST